MEKIKFVLNGCDISFVAEAPANITLKELLEQCDKIKPDWCDCGICSMSSTRAGYDPETKAQISIDYDSIKKNSFCSCKIEGNESVYQECEECGAEFDKDEIECPYCGKIVFKDVDLEDCF